MTYKIDIYKLAIETTDTINVLAYDRRFNVILSALSALDQEHTDQVTRLEAGCAQCRVEHGAKVKGLEAEIARLLSVLKDIHAETQEPPTDGFSPLARIERRARLAIDQNDEVKKAGA